ncbi:MAG: protein kinase [Deltaproteobacteria bacterium]|nr:protein kinase [Deltaproteobacteria bacterium]
MDETEVPSREGETLKGKYLLLERLGVGGMGEVYRARNTLLDRVVAIKVLHADLAKNKQVVQRFTREAKAANVVRHRNIVDVLDIDQDESGLSFIVQEYLEGEDFGVTLEDRGGSIPATEALDILIPVAEAVGVAHEKGLVHRDLKPENVYLALVDDEVVPKILDFGISKLAVEAEIVDKPVAGDDAPKNVRLTAAGQAMGTPAYMSPEQIRDPSTVDARTDVWAIGVMLYEAASGRLPFDAETLGDLFVEICTREPPPLDRIVPDVPKELAQIVRRCLRPEPLARHADAMTLSKALARCRDQMAAKPEPSAQLASSSPPGTRPSDRPAQDRGAALAATEPANPSSPPLELELDVPHSRPPGTSSSPPRRDSVSPGDWQLEVTSSSPPAPANGGKRISSPRPRPSAPPPPVVAPVQDDIDVFELSDDGPAGVALELDEAATRDARPSSSGMPRAALTTSQPPRSSQAPLSGRSRVHLSRTPKAAQSNTPELVRLVLASLLAIAVVFLAPRLSPQGLASLQESFAAQAFLAYAAGAVVLLVTGLWTLMRAAKMVSLFLFIASLAQLLLALSCGASTAVLTAPGLIGGTLRIFALVAAPWAAMAVPAGYGLFAVMRARELRGEGGSRRSLAYGLIACCVGGLALAAWTFRAPRPTIDEVAKMVLVPAEARTVSQFRRFSITVLGARGIAIESAGTTKPCMMRPTHRGATVAAAVATPPPKK